MISGVADTHAVLWYLLQSNKLSTKTHQFIEAALQKGEPIGISSISLFEIVYLVEKGRIPAVAFTNLVNQLDDFRSGFMEIVPNILVARAMSRIDVLKIPDFPDRIIAATALHYAVPLLSRDRKITVSGIETIW